MLRRIPALLLAGALLLICGRARADEADVRVACPPSGKELMTGVIPVMRAEKELRVATDPALTSADVLYAVASGSDGMGLITRVISGEDRSGYPEVDFVTVPIGMEVVAVAVSDDVWDAGIRTITRETMRKIYEAKVTNWRQIGGPDLKITFFNFEQGQGVWEIFAEWLYGDNRKAPFPKVEKVATSLDARDLLEFTPGSISPIAAGFADGSRCHALGIDMNGKTAVPTPAEVANGTYPIVRPILAVMVGRPTLGIRAITEYLIGPQGQALVRKTGALGLGAVPEALHTDERY